jgi:hypothetical protein
MLSVLPYDLLVYETLSVWPDQPLLLLQVAQACCVVATACKTNIHCNQNSGF